MDALLLRREPWLVRADLSDDSGSDARPGDAVGRVPDDLVGEVVDRPAIDQGFRGVIGLAVPARTHHDVEVGRLGQPDQPARVATDTRRREVDDRRSTHGGELQQLLGDDRLVAAELPVVPAIGDVPERDRGVLVRQREPESRGVDRTADGLDMRVRHEARSPLSET